jgi:hypothetical protein
MLVVYPINFNNIPSPNFVLESRIAPVTSGVAGRLYLNLLTGFVEVWNGTTTLVLGAQTSTLANPNTVALRDANGALTASTFNGALNGNASTASVAANAILLTSQNGAYYLNRANHTGTQLSATISDLPANIQSTRLDQFAIPQGPLNLNNFKVFNLADPALAQDAATKRYVDNATSTNNSLFLPYTVYDPGHTGKVNYAVNADTLAGVGPSYYLNRANHAGTQLSSSISDFVPRVQTVSLDSLAPPVNNVNLAGFKITLLGAPGVSSDAANKAYVDSSIAAIPPTQWSSILGTPPFRGTLQALPTPGSTASDATESIGYDHYYFYSTSGWRRIFSIPFRPFVAAPATSSATGTLGQSAYDTNFFYLCVATNSWKRIALSTWPGSVPFPATAVVQPGYTFTDGSYYYIAIAINTWMRFPLSSFSGVSSGVPVPTQSYYPGLVGMETFDSGFWYYCAGQNQWGRAALSSF